jgi:Mn-dependent DtxR family transcriptional regulator
VETLQQLTRRQLDALRTVGARETSDRGVPLKQIARALKVRPASALGHLTPLEELGLVYRHRGKTRLTAKGRVTLREYERHHRVAENLFRRLGLSLDQTCRAASEVDLALSHRTIDRLCAASGHSLVCPHGQPIKPCSSDRTGGFN